MQPDLFGDPAPAAPAYVVPYPIAVNTLRRTLEMLQAAEVWPWDADMKAARKQRPPRRANERRAAPLVWGTGQGDAVAGLMGLSPPCR